MSSTVLFNVYIMVLILTSSAVIAYRIAKPGCPSSCGNVKISYPYGIGNGCYKDKWFEITCNYSMLDGIPFLSSYQVRVFHIAPQMVRIGYFWGFPHWNSVSTSVRTIEPIYNDEETFNPFVFCHIHNKLVALGCDIFTNIYNKFATNYTNGCIAVCTGFQINLTEVVKCSGIYCCQSTIPLGLKSFDVEIADITFSNQTVLQETCRSAFVSEREFSPLSDSYNDKEIPLMLRWVIGNTTCEEMRNQGNVSISNNACGNNAQCATDAHQQGYRCQCNPGYQGNPYLPDGCQDIDECEKPGRCKETEVCHNIPGGSYCSCAEGYHKADGGLYNCIPMEPKHPVIKIVALGIAVGLSLAVILGVCFICLRRVQKQRQVKLKQMFLKRNVGLLLQQVTTHGGAVGKTIIFKREDLEKATDNFNEHRVCGKGGFGTVYKGMLSDGRIVAIKKSQIIEEGHLAQFINEVVILSQINHRNIVKLLGCCLETEVPLLVSEFVSNGTLFFHLHDNDYVSSISWENRLRMATEVAGALSYLHSGACAPIFHRDVKSKNILLDENYMTKVSDFGLSRSMPIDKSHLTTKVQGTFGYLDPEYFHSSKFTDKSDVYSFGVILVELLTGERAVSDSKFDEEEKSLVMNFKVAMKENRLFEIVETQILIEAEEEELLLFAKLAKRCVKLNGKKRPTMKEVFVDLEKVGFRKIW